MSALFNGGFFSSKGSFNHIIAPVDFFVQSLLSSLISGINGDYFVPNYPWTGLIQ